MDIAWISACALAPDIIIFPLLKIITQCELLFNGHCCPLLVEEDEDK